MPRQKYSDWQREQIYNHRKNGLKYDEIVKVMDLNIRIPASLSTQLRVRQERITKGIYDPKFDSKSEVFKGRNIVDEELENNKDLEPETPRPLICSIPHPDELSDYEIMNNFQKHYSRK